MKTLEPEIIFEDADMLVVNKPVGLVVHSDGRTEERTLSDWVLEKFPEMKNVGEPWISPEGTVISRPGIVHRLDRETSGVMVLAKNQEMFEFLKEQFSNRGVEKSYRVFVRGAFKEKEGVVDKPIGKSRSDFRKWSAEFGARGKMRDAITEYRVLAECEDAGEQVSFLDVRPKTGRTHQIRVHLKAVGKPVVGDALYAPKNPALLGFSRLALHAFTLQLTDITGEKRCFDAPLPEDFVKALESCDSERTG